MSDEENSISKPENPYSSKLPTKSRDFKENAASETEAESVGVGHGAGSAGWAYYLGAAVLATIAGVVFVHQFSGFFQISQEMANIPPDSSRTDEAEDAITAVQLENRSLVISLTCAVGGLLFALAGGLQYRSGVSSVKSAAGGLLVGMVLGLSLTWLAGAIPSSFFPPPDVRTMTTAQQDTQKMMSTAVEQGILFLGICVSAIFAARLSSRQGSWMTQGIGALVAAVIAVAVYQMGLAILLPTENFDQIVPEKPGVAALWMGAAFVMAAVTCARLSRVQSPEIVENK